MNINIKEERERDKQLYQIVCEEINVYSYERKFIYGDKEYSVNYIWKKLENGRFINVKEYKND